MDNNGETKESKGGKARAKSLNSNKRKEIARKGAIARWEKAKDDFIDRPIAIHPYTQVGVLKIGDIELPCAVLENGTPVITYSKVTKTLGRAMGGKQRKLARSTKRGNRLPDFLYGAALEPFVPESLRVALNHPVMFRTKGGIKRGLPATLIPEICEVWLNARDAQPKVLQDSQMHIVKNAEMLMRGLARVGITALVYEATGYEKVKGRDELEKILEAYIAKELMPWTKMFPDEFYEYMFKLKGWQYNPLSVKRPKIVGKLTNHLIYEQLPKGVLEDLRKKNPVLPREYRKHKFFQFLTTDIGNPHLANQIVAVTTLFRVATSWANFERLFNRRFSKQIEMKFAELEEKEK